MIPELPRGIWYEPDRNRYRVRLYRRSQVVWRSYHFHIEEALEALSSALQAQTTWIPENKKVPKPHPQNIIDLFR